jgi:outer membrane protein OmpA-like peptidoglycan-associated protein
MTQTQHWTPRVLCALGALLAASTSSQLHAQAEWGFAPRSARTTDAVIARDLAWFDGQAQQAASSRERLYVHLAREAYERNDDGRLSAQLLAAARRDETPRGATRPELWETLRTARTSAQVPTFVLDSLEVALLRAAHPVLGAPSCAQWEQRADALAATARVQMASAAREAAVPSPVAEVPRVETRPRRPGPLPDRVHFALDRDELSAASQVVLAAIADSLRDAGPITIELEGHTDVRATDAYNNALSARRADAVRRWLVQRGVDATRVTTRALGRAQPLAQGNDVQAHARNRRVLMRFVAPDGTVLATVEQRDDLQVERR